MKINIRNDGVWSKEHTSQSRIIPTQNRHNVPNDKSCFNENMSKPKIIQDPNRHNVLYDTIVLMKSENKCW